MAAPLPHPMCSDGCESLFTTLTQRQRHTRAHTLRISSPLGTMGTTVGTTATGMSRPLGTFPTTATATDLLPVHGAMGTHQRTSDTRHTWLTRTTTGTPHVGTGRPRRDMREVIHAPRQVTSRAMSTTMPEGLRR